VRRAVATERISHSVCVCVCERGVAMCGGRAAVVVVVLMLISGDERG